MFKTILNSKDNYKTEKTNKQTNKTSDKQQLTPHLLLHRLDVNSASQ